MAPKAFIASTFYLFVFICAGFSPVFPRGEGARRCGIPKPKHRFIVIAHRGAHNLYPENSLASFSEGARLGVDYVEMDLRTTKDSVLIILHDATLDRTTGGRGAVSEWNYNELTKLKIKSDKPGFSESIPTFEQTLQACRNKVGIYLDFKSASVPQTMLMIRKYGMEDQVIVYINSPAQYVEWRKREPAMPLMLSLPDSVKTAPALKRFLAAYPAALLDGDYTGYTAEMLAEASAENVPAWPDIQGKEEATHWESAVATGFKGLQTDHPEALIAWLQSRGLR